MVVAILFIVQLALGILAFVTVQSGEAELHKQIDKLLEDEYQHYWNSSSSTKEFIDDLQWNVSINFESPCNFLLCIIFVL